jgi:hypothetical protein
VLNLVSRDVPLDGQNVAKMCHKQWKAEEFRKSLKPNAALGKSLIQTVTTRNNQVFMAIFAMFKLDYLTMRNELNFPHCVRGSCSRQPHRPMSNYRRCVPRKVGRPLKKSNRDREIIILGVFAPLLPQKITLAARSERSGSDYG